MSVDVQIHHPVGSATTATPLQHLCGEKMTRTRWSAIRAYLSLTFDHTPGYTVIMIHYSPNNASINVIHKSV